MLIINNTTSISIKLFVSVLKERKMMSIRFIVALGVLCLIGIYIQKEMGEAGSSLPSFAGQFGWIDVSGGFGSGVKFIVDMVADALAGPRGRPISCTSSLYCRTSGNGLCCCDVFDYPQCVATFEECNTWIGGEQYYGHCLDPS